MSVSGVAFFEFSPFQSFIVGFCLQQIWVDSIWFLLIYLQSVHFWLELIFVESNFESNKYWFRIRTWLQSGHFSADVDGTGGLWGLLGTQEAGSQKIAILSFSSWNVYRVWNIFPGSAACAKRLRSAASIHKIEAKRFKVRRFQIQFLRLPFPPWRRSTCRRPVPRLI